MKSVAEFQKELLEQSENRSAALLLPNSLESPQSRGYFQQVGFVPMSLTVSLTVHVPVPHFHSFEIQDGGVNARWKFAFYLQKMRWVNEQIWASISTGQLKIV